MENCNTFLSLWDLCGEKRCFNMYKLMSNIHKPSEGIRN